MKERPRLSSGSLLMLELIFAIVFFSLAASVTVSVFGKAYEMSKKATDMDQAMTVTDNAAEMVRSADSAAGIESLFTGSGMEKQADGSFSMKYDKDEYMLTVTPSVTGRLYNAKMTCTSVETGEVFYELTVSHMLREVDDEG